MTISNKFACILQENVKLQLPHHGSVRLRDALRLAMEELSIRGLKLSQKFLSEQLLGLPERSNEGFAEVNHSSAYINDGDSFSMDEEMECPAFAEEEEEPHAHEAALIRTMGGEAGAELFLSLPPAALLACAVPPDARDDQGFLSKGHSFYLCTASVSNTAADGTATNPGRTDASTRSPGRSVPCVRKSLTTTPNK